MEKQHCDQEMKYTKIKARLFNLIIIIAKFFWALLKKNKKIIIIKNYKNLL